MVFKRWAFGGRPYGPLHSPPTAVGLCKGLPHDVWAQLLTEVDIAERSAADLPSQPVLIADPQFHRSSSIIYGTPKTWCTAAVEVVAAAAVTVSETTSFGGGGGARSDGTCPDVGQRVSK